MIGCKVMRTLASVEIEIILILGLPCCLSSSMRCLENVVESHRMSTLVFIGPEISTHADGAQSSRVPVPLPEDPYEAIRHAYLVGTDTESEPFEDPESEGSDTSSARSTSSDSTAPLSPDHPLTHTTPTLVPILYRTTCMVVRVPPAMSPGLSASMAEVAAMSDSVFRKRFRSFYEISPYSSPSDLPSRKRFRGTSELVEDEEEEDGEEEDEEMDESSDSDSVSDDVEDEGPTAEDEDPAAGDEGLADGGRGPRSKSVPERVSALRQPTLTTRIDLEDGITYIDVPAYPPPAQTLPSPEWSSGLLPISPAPFIVPSPISSPMIPLTVPSLVASPATAETEGFLTEYDRDIGELFTRSGEVRDEIFSQRYRFRSLEHEQERVVVTFGSIWRPVLALESWAEEGRARLDLDEIVESMRRGQEPRGDV
ncbi:hypothetical protein Tco_0947431 [Tanacetum coccineum]